MWPFTVVGVCIITALVVGLLLAFFGIQNSLGDDDGDDTREESKKQSGKDIK